MEEGAGALLEDSASWSRLVAERELRVYFGIENSSRRNINDPALGKKKSLRFLSEHTNFLLFRVFSFWQEPKFSPLVSSVITQT